MKPGAIMPVSRPHLCALSTVVPPYELSQGRVMARASHLFPGMPPASLDRLMPVYDNAGIATRYSCVPEEWYERDHGWAEKNRLFLDNAVDLLERAARHALSDAGISVEEIDTIVSVSTTGIATPSLDARVMERLGTRRDVARVPLFGLGCAGGVLGLARAASFARERPSSNVLVLVAELCALTFRRSDMSKSNVIASALFGDGAAAAVLSCAGEGPRIADSGEHTWPGSLDVMGWSVEDDGLGVVFSRDIPSLTRGEFGAAVREYLHRGGRDLTDVDHFVCHPGGAKVLDALEEVFGLAPGELMDSRAVLREFGNMSAVTVLFVLHRMLETGKRGRMLLSSLGPGFTAAFLTLETW